MELCGRGWSCVGEGGAVWERVELCGRGWSCVGEGGAVWERVELCGRGWSYVGEGGAVSSGDIWNVLIHLQLCSLSPDPSSTLFIREDGFEESADKVELFTITV